MSKKKVLVIGGTGIAGQFITDYLLHYHDICELFIASRGIHKISEKKVKFIKMDIHDTQNIESVIKQFDIILNSATHIVRNKFKILSNNILTSILPCQKIHLT